jgi:hypothetical protein
LIRYLRRIDRWIRNLKITAIPVKKNYGGNDLSRTSMADEDGDLEVPWGLLLGIYQIGIPAT